MKTIFFFCFLITFSTISYTQTILYVTEDGNDNNNGLSWENSLATVQKAIDEADKLTPKGQVWISQGIYFPTVTTDGSTEENKKAFVLKDGISVNGGFLGNELNLNERVRIDNDGNGTIEQWEFKYSTILSGDIDGEEDVFSWKENEEWKTPRCEWVVSGTENNCEYTIWPEKNEFENETIIDGVVISGAKQLGIKLYNNISLKNSTIKNNARGGWLKDGGVIKDCSINNNYDTGVVLSGGEVDNCSICKNTANQGGGVYFNFGGIVKNSIIKENYAVSGGGVLFWGNYDKYTGKILSGKILNCNIVNNDAGSGGGIYSIDYGIVINSFVDNNNGGGVECYINGNNVDNVGVKVTNSTIVNNNEAGIICAWNYLDLTIHGSGVFENTIIWGNEGSQISGPSLPRISFCAIEGGYDTDEVMEYKCIENLNLNEDNNHIEGPNFMDPSIQNWKLSENSPCIDFGNNTLIPSVYDTDLIEQPRIQGYEIDLGCYESSYYKGARPEDVVVEGVDESSVMISWTIRDNLVTNTWSVDIRKEGEEEWENIIVESNPCTIYNLEQATGYDIRVASIFENLYTSCFSTSTNFVTTSKDITPSSEGIVYVSNIPKGNMDGSSWANATNDIQKGINAVNTKEVWVSEGVYYPTLQFTDLENNLRNRSFIIKPNIKIYGGFEGNEITLEERNEKEHTSIFEGNLSNKDINSDNSFHVVYFTDTTVGEIPSLLDGVTIRNGYGENGSSIFISNGGKVENCVITENYSSVYYESGGTIYCNNGEISNCYVHRNTSTLKYERGTTIFAKGDSKIEYCCISDNNGYGLYINSGSVNSCNIFNNNNGLVIKNGYIFNSCIYNNTNYGIVADNESKIINCNIVNNNLIGFVINSTFKGLIKNSIIWNNKTNLSTYEDYYYLPAYTIEYCAIENGDSDNYNIPLSSDNNNINGPNFIDWENGVFSLNRMSPCIDKGSNDDVNTIYDIEGNDRVINNIVDIGAYEKEFECTPPNLINVTINRSSASIDWKVNGNETQWNVRYGVKSENMNWYEKIAYSNNTTIDNLILGETYVVQVGAYCSQDVVTRYIENKEFKVDVISIIPSDKGISFVKEIACGNMDGSSWENATNNIQAAIDAEECKQVWVAEGEYYPINKIGGESSSNERLKSFQPKNGIKIYGGFCGDEISISERNILENETVLSGDIGIKDDFSDNSYHVVYFNMEEITDTTFLDGFYICFGNANVTGADDSSKGGGVFNGCVYNCVINKNKAYWEGGGLYNCDLILNCIVSDNYSFYYGGGIGSGFEGNTKIINSTIVHNIAGYGSGVSYGYITNSIVWRNRTPEDEIENQIINVMPSNFDNSACEYIYGDEYNSADDIVLNELNTHDNGPNFVSIEDGNFQLRANSPCIDKGKSLLVYTCPDGYPSGFCRYNYVKTDIIGNNRIVGGNVDIGAFEFNGDTQTLIYGGDGIPDNISVFPNPTNGIVSIKIENFRNVGYVEIYNAFGMKIIEKRLETNNETFDLKQYSKGLYLIKLYIEKQVIVKKILLE
ncbi:choice-of-anchor Q domain-containing protein [Plebeiibacterium marinum]|uniref:Probable pectate lyase C n=1 Tax=Plebeiibacterium marinum TaxID=2992111 RepID=A0AAE3MFL6_9BACT|nr:choice-of-anchor Q domain-containing protein [Plebeiobacterium marinum]MCW3806162.1 T9SS type A sorting domain-containing protein [Plebeiobacterium marinum]